MQVNAERQVEAAALRYEVREMKKKLLEQEVEFGSRLSTGETTHLNHSVPPWFLCSEEPRKASAADPNEAAQHTNNEAQNAISKAENSTTDAEILTHNHGNIGTEVAGLKEDEDRMRADWEVTWIAAEKAEAFADAEAKALKAEAKTARARAETAEGEARAAKEEAEAATAETRSAQSETEAAKKATEIAEKQAEAARAETCTAKAETEAAERAVKIAEKQAEAARTETRTAKAEIEAAKEEASADQKGKLDKAEKGLAALKAEASVDGEAEIKSLNFSLSEIKKENAAGKAERDKYRQANRQSSLNLGQANRVLQETQQRLSKTSTNLANLQKDAEELRNALTLSQSNESDLQGRVELAALELEEQRNVTTSLRTTVGHLSQRLETVEQTGGTIAADVSSQAGPEIDRLRAENASLKAQLDRQAEEQRASQLQADVAIDESNTDAAERKLAEEIEADLAAGPTASSTMQTGTVNPPGTGSAPISFDLSNPATASSNTRASFMLTNPPGASPAPTLGTTHTAATDPVVPANASGNVRLKRPLRATPSHRAPTAAALKPSQLTFASALASILQTKGNDGDTQTKSNDGDTQPEGNSGNIQPGGNCLNTQPVGNSGHTDNIDLDSELDFAKGMYDSLGNPYNGNFEGGSSLPPASVPRAPPFVQPFAQPNRNRKPANTPQRPMATPSGRFQRTEQAGAGAPGVGSAIQPTARTTPNVQLEPTVQRGSLAAPTAGSQGEPPQPKREDRSTTAQLIWINLGIGGKDIEAKVEET
ncbi:hypothetical protein MMC30_006350 [Trapelia coarctata]|nr:hypothetical protein [Trapelia coarctata]